jgi:Skp family chaperone for outer membrane proteins
VKIGGKMDDIAAKMKTGKTVWQAADEEHVDWKQIANEAKKLSGKVDSNLTAHFANRKAEAERDKADAYDPAVDSVRADSDVSQQDMEDAQQRYVFLRDHTSSPTGASLGTSDERAARTERTDPTKTGGPTGPGNPPPANPGKN